MVPGQYVLIAISINVIIVTNLLKPLTVFLTSFANFGTLEMIIGTFKGIVDKPKNDLIAQNVGYMLLSGILVSLLSAGMVGLFVW